MIYAQDQKKVAAEPLSYTNGATATLLIDRLGFDYCSLDIMLGRVNNATNVPSVLKVQEADVTNTTSFVDVTAFAGTNLIPAALGTTNGVNVTANIDCRNRKRYLQLAVSPVTTEVIAAIANLSRGKQAVVTAVDANVSVLVNG